MPPSPVQQLQAQNGELNGKVQKLEVERQTGNAELFALQDQLRRLVEDTEMQQKRKEKLDADLKTLGIPMGPRKKIMASLM